MAISQKELAKKKSMAKLLIEANGENFDEWLAKKYDETFQENEDVIQKALKELAKNNQQSHQ